MGVLPTLDYLDNREADPSKARHVQRHVEGASYEEHLYTRRTEGNPCSLLSLHQEHTVKMHRAVSAFTAGKTPALASLKGWTSESRLNPGPLHLHCYHLP